LLRVVKLAVSTSTDFVTHSWLKINENSARYMLAGSSLGEKGVEGVIATTNGLIGWHLAVRLDSVLKAVKLPASISGLHACLANVN